MSMSKLNKYHVQCTIGGEIAIVEMEKKQDFAGLSFFKDKSEDKANEVILAVMAFLNTKIQDSEKSITVESSLGKLTFEKNN